LPPFVPIPCERNIVQQSAACRTVTVIYPIGNVEDLSTTSNTYTVFNSSVLEKQSPLRLSSYLWRSSPNGAKAAPLLRFPHRARTHARTDTHIG